MNSGIDANVPKMIPPGTICGGTTCLSRYTAILGSSIPGDRVGLATSLGNTFWYNAYVASQASCSSGGFGLSTQVSPAGSGSVVPAAVAEFCSGQNVLVTAYPAVGYAFQSWTGSGSGSYTGSANPVTVTMTAQISETANFVPSVSETLAPAFDGMAQGSGLSHTSIVTVSGQPQSVTFSASGVPAGVTASFSPPGVTQSLSGASTTMTVSYSGANQLGNLSFSVVATGANGQTAKATYTLSSTPPNGAFAASAAPVSAYTPREHNTAVWLNTQMTMDFIPYVASPLSYAKVESRIVYYSGGAWVAGAIHNNLGTCAQTSMNLDLFQKDSLVFMVSSNGGFNIATIDGSAFESWSWSYVSSQCVPGLMNNYLFLTPGDYASVFVDNSNKIWLLWVEKNGGNYYLELFTVPLSSIYPYCLGLNGNSNNCPFTRVYFSQAFTSEPVPQLMVLPNGYVVITYALSASACPGDYMLYSTNGGTSFNGPIGPETTAGGSALCYGSSSGTSIGDTVYFGGKNSAGSLAYWSYNFDTMTSSSPAALVSGIDYGAASSVNGLLVFAYSKLVSGSGEQLYLTWSVPPASAWKTSAGLGYSNDAISVPMFSESFQVAVAGRAYSTAFCRLDFYTV